jgi:hypothetical protein
MKKHLLFTFFGLILPILAFGVCQRPDREHINPEITRCPYLQENIYKAFAEKPGCYKDLEKYHKCFFCECPISEHTTEVKKEVKRPIKTKQRGVINNSLSHG